MATETLRHREFKKEGLVPTGTSFHRHTASWCRRVAFLSLALLCSCLSLDPFLWKGEQQTAYELDNFTGEYRECDDVIDSLGPVNPADVHFITFASGANTIWSVLLSSDTVLTAPSDTLILYFYGRTRNIDFYWPRARLLYQTGYAVLAVDYPGYGQSTGEPTEEGVYQMGRDVLGVIGTRLGNPKVIVYAYSTGTWIACELASTDAAGQIKRLILEAPYSSMETLVQDASYLNIPASYVTTLEGDNVGKISSVTIPLLWIHGENDNTLDRETHGQLLWDTYPGTEAWYIVARRSDHTEVPSVIGYTRYVECVRQFITGTPADDIFVAK